MLEVRSFLTDPGFYADPYATYDRWRAETPVRWEPALRAWSVTSHAAASAALADPHLSSDRTEAYLAGFPRDTRDALGPFARARSDMMLFVDPPKHTRLRGLVQKAFTPKMIEQLRPRVEQLVRELLAPAEANGAFDLITGLAEPLPGVVIAELLGVPPADRPQFKGWALDFATAISGGVTPEVALHAQSGLLAMTEYLRPIIAERRVRPADDLLSALVAVVQQGELLSETELVATCMLLLIAGSETTTNLIGNGMLALLRNPDQLAQLRADEEGIRPAVEELLRYDSPIQASFRVAREATVIAGAPIRSGDMVVLVLGAANRDPALFPEPNRLDVGRGDRRHLSFAHGPHFCLGAALARLEGQVAITAILKTLPSMRLASDQPDWRPLFAFRGLRTLPVTC